MPVKRSPAVSSAMCFFQFMVKIRELGGVLQKQTNMVMPPKTRLKPIVLHAYSIIHSNGSTAIST